MSYVPFPTVAGTKAPDPANWSCQIGEFPRGFIPPGSDAPMRDAVRDAYRRVTGGHEPVYIFSGWGDPLAESLRAVVESRLPDIDVMLQELVEREWQLSDPESIAKILRGLPDEVWRTLLDLVASERS